MELRQSIKMKSVIIIEYPSTLNNQHVRRKTLSFSMYKFYYVLQLRSNLPKQPQTWLQTIFLG
jgi:hypothetical protein